MAAEAAHANASNAVQAHPVTKSTGTLNIACGIMERGIRSGPSLWMGIIDAMATFAAVTADTENADIETWIATRTAGLPVAWLAESQIGLGVRAMIRPAKIAAVKGMRRLTGTIGMASLAVEAGREAAGRGLAAAQVLTMAGTAGCRAVQGSETSMIDEGVRPARRME